MTLGVVDGGDEVVFAIHPSPDIHHHHTNRIMLFMSANSPGDLNTDFQQILAHYQQSVTAQLQTAKNTLRTIILPGLLQSGVANVEAAYSGYGDSGAIDGVQYRNKSGVRVEREKIPAGLKEQLENVLYEFLPAGFEINDGSQGNLTIDAQTAKVTIQHQENYTESRDSTREFDL